jgi:multidrug efflux system outer membrane protein
MKGILLILITSSLTACAVGPDYQTPKIATAANFNEANHAEFSNKAVEVSWWKLFKDEQLNRLVDETLRHNYELKAAQANLREARALYMETGLNLAPTVTSHANHSQQLRSVGALNNRSFVPRDLELYNTGFDAYWELDLFGRVRRNVEASSDEVELQEANIRDVSVSLIAEVARNYFELRGLQNQLAVVKQNVENQAQTLKITDAKVRNGRGTELDTARASAQLDSTRALVPTLETSISYAIHRLSVLTGQQPHALIVQLSDAKAMPQLPDTIAIGSPADLLRRRPDIRMAERRLAASTARIGVATADLFPKVTFVGTISMEASTFSGLGAAGSQTNSFGPRITWAAFNLGQVYARIKAADAHAESDLAQYQQTVLTALEETENALVNYNKIREKQVSLSSATEASLKANHLAQLRFDGGVTDFLTVLDAQLSLLYNQNQLAQTQTATAMALVSVYKALGGGWEI